MRVGYCRTSTAEQVAGLDAQVRELKAAGVEKIFSEQLSSVDASRQQLAAALDFVREGDVLIVTRIDRLARNVGHLCAIEAQLHATGASLLVLNPAIDTSTPIGRLVFNTMAAIAQFEREIMLERQREGIAKAKADGKYKGRPPKAHLRVDVLRQAVKDGQRIPAAAKLAGMSERTAYRLLGAAKIEA
jgi:DNA invertase Pin-like site-specific DNA recombinase